MKKLLFFLPLAAFGISAKSFLAPATNGSVFTLSMSSSKGMTGTITIYYDVPGTRIEVNASANGFRVQKTSIVKKSEPDLVYQLDDKSKTYSTVDVSNAETEKADEPAKATLLGTDSLNGFFCKHVKVVQGAKNWEVWTTSAIAEYTQCSAVMNRQRYIGNHGMHDALKTISADGFPVKLILTDKDGTTTTELKKVEHKPLAVSLFSVPADYKKGGAPVGMPPGGYPHPGAH
jgi:hypothetical protein